MRKCAGPALAEAGARPVMMNIVDVFCKACLAALLVSFPAASQTIEEQVGLRLIIVRSEAEATSLLNQIQSGQSFEEIAKAHSVDP